MCDLNCGRGNFQVLLSVPHMLSRLCKINRPKFKAVSLGPVNHRKSFVGCVEGVIGKIPLRRTEGLLSQ